MGIKESEMKNFETQLSYVLTSGEQVIHAYKLKNNYIVLTSLRLIDVKNKKFLSIPYNKIMYWESDCNSKLALTGTVVLYLQDKLDYSIEFNDQQAACEFERTISKYIK